MIAGGGVLVGEWVAADPLDREVGAVHMGCPEAPAENKNASDNVVPVVKGLETAI